MKFTTQELADKLELPYIAVHGFVRLLLKYGLLKKEEGEKVAGKRGKSSTYYSFVPNWGEVLTRHMHHLDDIQDSIVTGLINNVEGAE